MTSLDRFAPARDDIAMADEKPLIHIDNDWKRQAQEEKKRLAEEESRKAAQAAAAPSPMAMPAAALPPGAMPAAGEQPAEPGSFLGLVRSLMTQTLFYLGDITTRGSQPMLDFDRAKLQLDMLKMLEEKTVGNLSDVEKHSLDTVLYDLRNRYVNLAAQYL